MKAYSPSQLRNVGLFGHGGAGKTTLCEAALFTAGALSRQGRVEEGTTASDYEAEEIKRRISICTAVLPLEWKEHKINLVDTPGYADFAGEIAAAIRVVDTALILADAISGVEVGTEQVWQAASEQKVARFLFISKIDRENADFNRTLEQLRDRFSDGTTIVPLQIPIGTQDAFNGVVDLVEMQAHTGANLAASSIPAEMQPVADQWREKLIEAVAETDDALIEKYLNGEELSEDEIIKGICDGIRNGKITPVLVGSGLANKAVSLMLDALAKYAPSPLERNSVTAVNQQSQQEETLTAADSGPLAALVFKTTADPFIGKLTYFRVFSGVLHSNSTIYNTSQHQDERIGQVTIPHGKTQENVTQIGAGDIGALSKLAHTGTGDTLSTREHPLVLPEITFPKPTYQTAIEAKTKQDIDKLSQALSRLAEEDHTIKINKDQETAETVISSMGESHMTVSAEKLKRKFGLEVNMKQPKIPYRETITMPTKAEYKHKKQSGGHGQYGHVLLELEPLERGTGFEFAERVVGGAVPRNFYPAVEKGVREALPEGVMAGYPVVDVKVTLYDGSYHDVDSSEMAFKIASSQAFKKGVEQAHPVLLEPIMNVTVTVPESFVGDILSDINSAKRGRVIGIEERGGLSEVQAQVPMAEMQHYATDLRSMTGGRGIFAMEYSHYEEVPAHIAQNVINAAKQERELAAKA